MHVLRKLVHLRSSDDGSVAPLVGLTFLALVCAAGVAIDLGRGQVAQSKLQASLDAAGLAAGATVSQNPTEEELRPEAEKYLYANFAGKTVDAVITDFDIDLSEDEHIVTLTATGQLPTTLMQVFGKKTMDIGARTEITREMKGLEIALVLDVTGSMTEEVSPTDPTQKIVVLKEAATDLMDTLFGSNATVDDLWIGIVPFSQNINVGTSHTDWLGDYAVRSAQDNCVGPTSGSPKCPASPPPESTANVSTRTNPVTLVDDWMFNSNSGWYFKPHGWGGCVFERWATGDDVTDTPPSDIPFQTFFFPDTPSTGTVGLGANNWRASNGNYQVTSTRSANKDCLTATITPSTNVKSTLVDAIDDLSASGNTLLPLGAVWGWRMLSPEWRGEWGGTMDSNGLPLDYYEDLSQKVMIFMTDGWNDMPSCSPSSGDPWDHSVRMTAYGTLCQGNLGTTSKSTADTVLNEKTAAICSSVKEQGILIYTIVFGAGVSQTSKDLMKACASEEDYYFYAESADALDGAFSAIGDSLSNLRISK
jgi:Flp pilus assembly protein TadG